MAEVKVVAAAGDSYEVVVDENSTSTTHTVTATPADVARYGQGAAPEVLVEASFRFLLDREPKESILARFDLPVIARYFPEYPDRVGDYLP